MPSATRIGVGLCATIAVAESGLIYLGRTYGSTPDEHVMRLPGDDIITDPKVQTDHAVTIEAPPSSVWPWLMQMGWGRGGWCTARWVDRLLFPANGPSADRIIPRATGHRGRNVHTGRAARDQVRTPCRGARSGTNPRVALEQPSARWLA